MRTSITSAGFTLIELLAVLVLLGLGLGIGLTLDVDGSPQQQQQQALLLANRLELAAQDAVLDDRIVGFDLFIDETQGTAYRLLELRDGSWQEFANPEEEVFTAAFTVTLALDGQSVSPEPRVDVPAPADFAPEVLLLPTRELTPFTLTFASAEGNASVLSADLMGRIRVDADAPSPP